MEDQKSTTNDKNQQESTVHISIGGRVGPGAAIGVGNQVKAETIVEGTYTTSSSTENVSRSDFVALLRQIQEQLAQLHSQFDPDDATDAQDAISKAEQISLRDNPPVDRLQKNLETVQTIVESAAKTSAAFAPLSLLVQQAFTWFSHLFVK